MGFSFKPKKKESLLVALRAHLFKRWMSLPTPTGIVNGWVKLCTENRAGNGIPDFEDQDIPLLLDVPDRLPGRGWLRW